MAVPAPRHMFRSQTSLHSQEEFSYMWNDKWKFLKPTALQRLNKGLSRDSPKHTSTSGTHNSIISCGSLTQLPKSWYLPAGR